jgi:hypothetical protein
MKKRYLFRVHLHRHDAGIDALANGLDMYVEFKTYSVISVVIVMLT